MEKNLVVIVTSKEDSHADLVIYKLNLRGKGEQVIRLNTEDFWSNTEVSTDGHSFDVKIKDSHRFFNSQQVLSVWFRRPKEIEVCHPDTGTEAFIKSQATALLRGLYFCTHDTALWVNPLPALHRSRNKLQQLQLAQKLGMLVPKTLVTNNSAKVKEFIENVPNICTKSLGEPNFQIDGHLFPFYTRKLTEPELRENLDGIEICPTLLQEYVDKIYEIRVTVIGEEIFPLAIYSQEHELSKVDWRGLSPARMKQELIEIPSYLKEQIIEFVKHQGLVFSAMDFAVTAEGNYFFLENNCNGQWQWVDDIAEGALSEAMINLLWQD